MKHPLVEVEWIDSAFNRGWGDAKTKTKEMGISVCRSVGYLMERNAKSVKIAMNSADDHQSFGDGISIPTCAVTRVRRLR